MNALQIAEMNRNLAIALYNAALSAHAQQQWDEKLKAAVELAAEIYQAADEAVQEAPGYMEQFSKGD